MVKIELVAAFLLASASWLPTYSLANSSCKINVDCANQTITIDGKESSIVCGSQTGKLAEGKSCKIGESGVGSGKSLSDGSPGLKAGAPKVLSEPINCLCDNCVFHEGSVAKGAQSKGCVHLTSETLSQIKQCKGSSFQIKATNGGGGTKGDALPSVSLRSEPMQGLSAWYDWRSAR